MKLLDPTAENTDNKRSRAARLTGLQDATIGLLDISKARGDIFLTQLEEELTARGATVKRYMKQTFAKPASPDLRARIAQECGAVIEALAD